MNKESLHMSRSKLWKSAVFVSFLGIAAAAPAQQPAVASSESKTETAAGSRGEQRTETASVVRRNPMTPQPLGLPQSVDGTFGTIFFDAAQGIFTGTGILLVPNAAKPYVIAKTGTANASSAFIVYSSNDVPRFWVGGSGLVGIGTPAEPVHKLDVAGNLVVGAGYNSAQTAPGDGMLVQGNVGIGTTLVSDRLHLGNTASGGITIDTSGPTKGRLITPVSDTVNVSINARYNGSGWLLDDATRDGWFLKLDARSSVNKFAVWKVPAGSGEHHDEVELLSLDATGKLTASNIAAQFQDVAEWVPTAEPLPPGTVVVVDPSTRNGVLASRTAYATSVAGVVSEKPGLLLGVASPAKAAIATTGRVKVRVDATAGAIQPGDLLVSSDKPGVAMRSKPIDVGGVAIHRPGTVIGKALEPLERGEGEILVLLSLQ